MGKVLLAHFLKLSKPSRQKQESRFKSRRRLISIIMLEQELLPWAP